MAGRLLVASPALGDPSFARAVVLLLDHDEDGALGVIINRPTPVGVDAVLPDWEPFATAPGVLFQGGPVALDSALGLAVVPVATATTSRSAGGACPVRLGLVDLDTPPEILAAEMADLRIFAGYAGWGAGQLEAELAEDAWYVVPAEATDAFSAEPEGLWSSVLRRQGGDLAFLSTYPEDPTMN